MYYRVSGTKIDLSISAEPDDLGATEDAAAGTAAAAAESTATDVAEVEKALESAEEEETAAKK